MGGGEKRGLARATSGLETKKATLEKAGNWIGLETGRGFQSTLSPATVREYHRGAKKLSTETVF